jgi:O-antigen ligase
MGLAAFLQKSVASRRTWLLLMAGLFVGLVSAMSRGPWVGAAATLAVLLITGPNLGSKLGKVAMAALVGIPILLSTEQGRKVLDYLPFIGTVETQNIDFRERLIDVSLRVLANYPIFGALDFLSHRDMEQMRGGDGIIDMVNTYLAVAMSTGFVGLTLFVAPFLLMLVHIAHILRRIPDKSSELHLLGRALLASTTGILVSIATVASIVAIPIVYLCVLGLGTGYIHFARQRLDQAARAGAPGPRSMAARQRVNIA